MSGIAANFGHQLRQGAASADGEKRWPEESWNRLRTEGVLRWCIPRGYGGVEISTVELLAGYEGLAAACLTTCFILSQREAACRRIRDHGSDSLRQELLPPLSRGELFATV